MIEADIRGRIKSETKYEDVFTSCCIGLLRLLPDSDLLNFLGEAIDIDGHRLSKAIELNLNKRRLSLALAPSPSVKFLEFWPRFPSGEPDVVLELGDDTILVIEIKHGSPKSGRDPENDEMSSGDEDDKIIGNQEDKTTKDQLAKYWCDACKAYPDRKIMLIYLTDHRTIPKNDLVESKDAAERVCKGGEFFWLNWFTLFHYIARALDQDPPRPYAEDKIFKLLYRYLCAKKYTCFLGWGTLPEKTIASPYFYTQLYNFLVSDKVSAPYIYNYELDILPTALKSFYIHNYELDILPTTANPLYFYSRQEEHNL